MHRGQEYCRTTNSLSNQREKKVARMLRMESDRCRPRLVFSVRLPADWGRYRKLLWRIQGPGCSKGEGCGGGMDGCATIP